MANPSVGTLYAVVAALGTTLDELIGDPAAAGASSPPEVPPEHLAAHRRTGAAGRRARAAWRCRAWSGSG